MKKKKEEELFLITKIIFLIYNAFLQLKRNTFELTDKKMIIFVNSYKYSLRTHDVDDLYFTVCRCVLFIYNSKICSTRKKKFIH